MVSTKPPLTEQADATLESRSFLLASRSGAYILLVLAVVLVAGPYSLRKYGLFNCPASGYGRDGYLAYCGATSFGDYDHGAFWFGLEPEATAAALKAQVLFIGNSRMQFGFSAPATADWFSASRIRYYLMGFSHFENFTFEEPLLRKLNPKPSMYVINIDMFFEQTETGPGRTVMHDESVRARYEQKRQWQKIHKLVCGPVPALCAHGTAYYRSRSDGAWSVRVGGLRIGPVTYDESVDKDMVASYTELGNKFLPTLSVGRECTLFTLIPSVNTSRGTAQAIAAALGVNFVSPELAGLNTFDESHMDQDSAQRWSAAFFEAAGPQIRQCLKQ